MKFSSDGVLDLDVSHSASPHALEPHFDALLREATAYCERQTRNAHDAEELAQEAFLRVLAGYRSVVSLSEFRAVLFTIMNRLCADVHRRRRQDLAFHATPSTASSKPADPAATILGRELSDALRQAVDELPASQRLALYLCTHQAMSYEDIARVMGKSLADVKVTIHRGRKRVQEQLNKYLKDEM